MASAAAKGEEELMKQAGQEDCSGKKSEHRALATGDSRSYGSHLVVSISPSTGMRWDDSGLSREPRENMCFRKSVWGCTNCCGKSESRH